MTVKFALHPGYFYKEGKAADHEKLIPVYISFSQLMTMYGLKNNQAIKWDDLDPKTFEGRNKNDYIHLYPVEDYSSVLKKTIEAWENDNKKTKKT